MLNVMPDKNMPVKNRYSFDDVDYKRNCAQNVRMKYMRKIRESRGLSQTQLAEMCGTTQPTISKVEKGDMNVTLSLIEAIAKALGVTPVDLFGMTESQQRLFSAISLLSEERKTAALTVIEAMSQPS